MRKKPALLALVVIGSVLAGCAPILKANFEADTVGSPPSLSPAGSPEGDRLTLQGSTGSIVVVQSGILGSKAVKLDRTSAPPATVFDGIPTGAPHRGGSYDVCFRAYSLEDKAPLNISIQSSTRKRAFLVVFKNGACEVISGNGKDSLPGPYSQQMAHTFCFRVRMSDRTFSVSVDDEWRITEQPFLDAEFSEIQFIRFEYFPAVLEAFPGVYVLDDLIISERGWPSIWFLK